MVDFGMDDKGKKSFRAGIIVPPENPTVEDEMRDLLPSSMKFATTRLPIVEGSLEERLSIYNDSLHDAGRSFGELQLEAIYLACTGSSYLGGPSSEGMLSSRMKSGLARSLTAAQAITETIQDLQRERIFVVSPYPEWLTRKATDHWNASGFEVTGVSKVPAMKGIYAIKDIELLQVLRDVDASKCDVVLLSGTGMPTIGAITAVGRDLGVPVISSSIAAAYVLAKWSGDESGLATKLVRGWF